MDNNELSLDVMKYIMEKLKDPNYILSNIPSLNPLINESNEQDIMLTPILYYAFKAMNAIFNENINHFKEYHWMYAYDTNKVVLELFQKVQTELGEDEVYSFLDLGSVDLIKTPPVVFNYHAGWENKEEIVEVGSHFAQRMHLLYDEVLHNGELITQLLGYRRFGKMEYAYINSGSFGFNEFKGIGNASGLMEDTEKGLIFKLIDDKMDGLIEKLLIEYGMDISKVTSGKRLKV